MSLCRYPGNQATGPKFEFLFILFNDLFAKITLKAFLAEEAFVTGRIEGIFSQ